MLNRLVAVIVLSASLGVLVTAAWLTPDAAGHGTHTQLGLPPCGLKLATGMPCVTCGMTTAFSFAAHGDLLNAVRVQPAGAVLAVLTAAAAIVASWSLWTGRSLAPVGAACWNARVIIPLVALILFSWAYTLALAIWSPA